MATEHVAHTIVTSSGDIEIRDYAETIVAEIKVPGTRRDSPSDGFMPLFRFIQGSNVNAQEIAMTAPVSQQQTADQSGNWAIAFHMPNGMALNQTPLPEDERISLREIPPQRMAAIRFSGRSTDSNMQEHEQELRAYLAANDLDFVDDPVYAYYSPPWTPWFLRHNEVLFALKTPTE